MSEDVNMQTVVQKQALHDSVTESADLVRKLNAQIRTVIERLPHDKGYLLGFFCECGCCEPVQLAIAEYDALKSKPVYRAGHRTQGDPRFRP